MFKKLFVIFFFVAAASIYAACDPFIFVTIPKSGSNLVKYSVLPSITGNGAQNFLHTWSYGDVKNAYAQNPALKGILVIRQPEDVIYSLINFMDKKVAWGDKVPPCHRQPKGQIDDWANSTYEQKNMGSAIGFEEHFATALAYFNTYHPFILRYEDVKNNAISAQLFRRLGKYLNAEQVTSRKTASIQSQLDTPRGWVFRSGTSGEGRKMLPKEVLEYIDNSPTYQEFKRLFGYE